MRALTSRDRHRDTRKAFVRHDTRTPSQRSVARRSKLDPQIDSEISTRIVISGVAEVDCAFLRKMRRRIFRSLMRGSKLRRRFSRELFENAIELRQRLEADCEGDFADPKIRILQEIARFADAYAGDVIDKVDPGHFFELLAQVIAADVAKLRDFRQRKFVIRVLVDEFSRFPNFYRLSAFSASGAEVSDLICGYHLYHPASSDFG